MDIDGEGVDNDEGDDVCCDEGHDDDGDNEVDNHNDDDDDVFSIFVGLGRFGSGWKS